MNQNQNSLLVKRQTDSTTPGIRHSLVYFSKTRVFLVWPHIWFESATWERQRSWSLVLIWTFWKGSLWRLSDRCLKKCYLLWWLLVLDPQNMQWNQRPLRPDPDFRCARCLGKARPIDGRLVKEDQVDDEKVEAAPEFCYLGDMLSAGGGCELAAVTRCKLAWDNFQQLLSPLHQPKPATFDQRSSVFNLCEKCNAVCGRNMGYDCGYT